ncbi:MAG: FKBP-type peptidyl-prolyl cis-trans isomerase [Alphaproteobacteria bacterium]|nr:FKBP-type peptidyl-prolyl cis-trans isomerase [Alphaproteobacteria bacterium]
MIPLRLLALAGLLAATASCGDGNQAPATSTANTLVAAPQGTATEWQRTPSGIQYRRVSGAGTGPKPSPTDTVTIHYIGKLMDGTEFDSSFRAGEPITMALPTLIPGWREGVPLMSVGDVYEFVIPPELGYGASEAGPIPANSTLHFTIGLIGIGGQG